MYRPIHNKWRRKEVKKRTREREKTRPVYDGRPTHPVQSISNNTFALLFLSWYFPIRFPYSSLVSPRLPVILSRSFRFSPMSCAHSGAHNASQRRRYFSSIIIIIIIIYISGFFTGLARSSLRAIDEGEKTTRAHGFPLLLCEPSPESMLCAHTHNTHRRRPLVLLTQPSAQQRTSVGRQQSSCLQRTSHVSLLRISSFAKFSKFRVFWAKTNKTVTFSVCCLIRVEYFAVFFLCRFLSKCRSEWVKSASANWQKLERVAWRLLWEEKTENQEKIKRVSKWPRLSIKFDWMADFAAWRERVQVNCQTNWILSTWQSKLNDQLTINSN